MIMMLTIGLLIGLFLMIAGVIIGCMCGLIKEVPRSALLCFAVIFVYIIAFAVDTSEANAMFLTSIPFIKQIKMFNKIIQQLSNMGDFTSIMQSLSNEFSIINFLDQAINLCFLTFEVGFIHKMLFPNRHHKWWIYWFIWYLKECLAIGVLIILNSYILNGASSMLPESVVVWIPRIFMILLVATIILCTLKLIFKFIFPLLDVFISFFSNNFVGKLIISSIISTGILILVAFAFLIFNIKISATWIGVVNIVPLAVPFFIVWYIVYALIGYKNK